MLSFAMDNDHAISTMKQIIQDDISYLCRRPGLHWNAAIVRTMRDLHECGGKAVFFGGAVRSLLFSRLLRGRLGRPRDIDVVVDELSLEGLRQRFNPYLQRETRFGGLQLSRDHWHFDIWPLNKTWAFVRDNVVHPTFDDLPRTTFFNLESIAIEVWPAPGTARVIFSGDDQFFDGVLSRTLELNRVENPFPALCVIRALVLASDMELEIGGRLARYLADMSSKLSDSELTSVQNKHYGRVRIDPVVVRSWLSYISTRFEQCGEKRIRLPLQRQKLLWPPWPKMQLILSLHADQRGRTA